LEIRAYGDKPFGADVLGVDLREVLTPSDVRALREALPRHRTLCFPDQDIAPEDFVRFGRMFGRPHPHVLEHLRLAGHPEILVLTNIVKDRTKPHGHNGAAFWHTDNSYEEEHASATMVHAKAVPAAGGETFLCDMAAAYRDLPAARRAELDTLTVRHFYGNRDAGKEHDAGSLKSDQKETLGVVTHPLVQTHPISGEKCLYAVAASARSIEGMPDDEGVDLLNELKEHCTREEYVAAKRYRVGDLFIWDTMVTMHAAAVMDEAENDDNTRVLHRISVKGYPPLPA
jgi:taurine dioxygenase